MTGIEALAVLLGLVYLLLAIRERRSCWIAGGGASLLFCYLLWDAELPMQALLQIYYLAIAVHAWWRWGPTESGSAPRITSCSRGYHRIVLAILFTLTASSLALTSWISDTAPDARGMLDTLTSWGGVIATWMIAGKKLEGWLYWIVIDLATAVLYLSTELRASAALYGLYTGLAWLGWREWRQSLQISNAS